MNKKTIFSIVIIIILAIVVYSLLSSDTVEGPFGTLLSLEVLNGEMLPVEKLKENPTLVVGWTSWCPTCIQELIYLEENYDTFIEKVNLITLNYSGSERVSVEQIARMVANAGFSFIVLADDEGKGYEQFPSKYLPSAFLIDTNGEILKSLEGPITLDILEQWLTEFEWR